MHLLHSPFKVGLSARGPALLFFFQTPVAASHYRLLNYREARCSCHNQPPINPSLPLFANAFSACVGRITAFLFPSCAPASTHLFLDLLSTFM